MADPAMQLARLAEAGFEIQTSERFPRSIIVSRRGAVALLELGPSGLRALGAPGWQAPPGAGVPVAVLVEEQGRPVFRAKQDIIDATSERLQELKTFREKLERLLAERG
jgi:hypothetical protein